MLVLLSISLEQHHACHDVVYDPLPERRVIDKQSSTAIVAFVFLAACTRGKDDHAASSSVSASPSASATSSGAAPVWPAPPDISKAVERLADKRQSVRDQAAEEIRKVIAANPLASRDRGQAYWKQKLAEIPSGTPRADFERQLRVEAQRPLVGGDVTHAGYRLDDWYVVTATFSKRDGEKLQSTSEPQREPRIVEVEGDANEMKSFTGTATFYFVNGMKAREYAYVKGERVRGTYYHENGRISADQRYLNGDTDGLQWGEHPNGQRAYEGRWSKGQRAGRWVYFFDNGKVKSETTYSNGLEEGRSTTFRPDGTRSSVIEYRGGEETGRAAWDEQGKLLDARGTLRGAGP